MTSSAQRTTSSPQPSLTFLLEKELEGSGWPFDAGFVLTNDPDITGVTAAPLPWHS